MRYHKPASFAQAIDIARHSSGITRFLAGGTDVLVQLRADIVSPDDLIDIKHIAGTHEVTRLADGAYEIGIAVSGAEMSEHETLGADWPGLVEAMDLIGSTQVQGRATLVGNLCNGSPAADSVPAMIAAGVTLRVEGPEGARMVRAEDIPAGPGKTTLGRGEMITKVHVPPRGAQGGDAYLRFIPRTEMDIAVVGCGANLRLEGDQIVEARMALGAVAPVAALVPEAVDILVGSTLDEATLAALAKAAEAACNPITDKRGTVEFRTEVAGVLAKRVARIAYQRAKGEAK